MTARSAVSVLAILSLILSLASPVSAQLVSTSQVLALEEGSQAQSTVNAYLARSEVVAQLKALGVDPELARLRVAALSVAELKALAGRIEEAPAGGGGVITVLGVTFLVLLILELVGVIDIFKKI